jgi:hypothetical protein
LIEDFRIDDRVGLNVRIVGIACIGEGVTDESRVEGIMIIKDEYTVRLLHSSDGTALERFERHVHERTESELAMEDDCVESPMYQFRVDGGNVDSAHEREEVSWRGVLNTSKGD